MAAEEIFADEVVFAPEVVVERALGNAGFLITRSIPTVWMPSR